MSALVELVDFDAVVGPEEGTEAKRSGPASRSVVREAT